MAFLFGAATKTVVSKDLTIAAGADGALKVRVEPAGAAEGKQARLFTKTTAGSVQYTVGLPDVPAGIPYTLVLTNDRAEDADAVIEIDGKSMGRFRVWARSVLAVKRPAHTTEWGDRAFTFFAAAGDKARSAGVATGTAESDAKNGAIVVTWHVEEPKVKIEATKATVESMMWRGAGASTASVYGSGDGVTTMDGSIPPLAPGKTLSNRQKRVMAGGSPYLTAGYTHAGSRSSSGTTMGFGMYGSGVGTAAASSGGGGAQARAFADSDGTEEEEAGGAGGTWDDAIDDRMYGVATTDGYKAANALAGGKVGATLLGKATGQSFSTVARLGKTLPPVVVPFRLVVVEMREEPEFVALNTQPAIVMPPPSASFSSSRLMCD